MSDRFVRLASSPLADRPPTTYLGKMLTIRQALLPTAVFALLAIAITLPTAGCVDPVPAPAIADSSQDISCGSWCGDDGDPYDASAAFGSVLAYTSDHFPDATHLTDTTCLYLGGIGGYECTISLLTGGVRCPVYTTCTSYGGKTQCDWGVVYNQCH